MTGLNAPTIEARLGAKATEPVSIDTSTVTRSGTPGSATAQPAASGQPSNGAADTSAGPPFAADPLPLSTTSSTAPPLRSSDASAAAAQSDGVTPAAERKPVLQAGSDLAASTPATTIDSLTATLAVAVPSIESHAATSAAPPTIVSASPSSASPAQQIAPALLAVTQNHDGIQRMTLRLNPAELGMVQVQIEHAATGPTHVVITAERTETLQMLQQDQPQLHRALDQAGVPAQGRTVVFHVAPVLQAASSHSSSGNPPFNSGQGSFAGTSGGGGSAGYAAREQTNSSGTRRTSTPSSEAGKQDETTPAKWLRVGLDITA